MTEISSYLIGTSTNIQVFFTFYFISYPSVLSNLLHHQVVELIDAAAINSTAVRLDWVMHVSVTEKYVEVRIHLILLHLLLLAYGIEHNACF